MMDAKRLGQKIDELGEWLFEKYLWVSYVTAIPTGIVIAVWIMHGWQEAFAWPIALAEWAASFILRCYVCPT